MQTWFPRSKPLLRIWQQEEQLYVLLTTPVLSCHFNVVLLQIANFPEWPKELLKFAQEEYWKEKDFTKVTDKGFLVPVIFVKKQKGAPKNAPVELALEVKDFGDKLKLQVPTNVNTKLFFQTLLNTIEAIQHKAVAKRTESLKVRLNWVIDQ